jgi:ABC-type dipeptide/oligopeptide/nickel transport system ATPase component
MATATRTNGKPAAKIEATAAERVIALIAGESGTGKSLWVASLKNALIFDTDLGGGLSYLDGRIARNGSERIEVSSYPEVMNAVAEKRRQGKLGNYTTIAIDHLTALQQEAVNRHNPNAAEDYGKSYDKATREWRKIRELVRQGDFNLVCTAHLKSKYENQKVVGITTDASKNINADMMVVLYLQKRPDGGYPSTAKVEKWRRDPEDTRGPVPQTFPFTMDEFIRIHGWPMEGERVEVPMASPEQVKEIDRLLETVKVPDGWAADCLKKVKVESWEEMTAETIGKYIAFLRDKAQAVAGATTPGSL